MAYQCTKCGGVGHNRRTCGKSPATSRVVGSTQKAKKVKPTHYCPCYSPAPTNTSETFEKYKQINKTQQESENFEFSSPGVKVDKLDIRWDMYWASCEKKELEKANKELTEAAISALENHDSEIWYQASIKYADLGAADTEPRAQFSKLWYKAFGEYA